MRRWVRACWVERSPRDLTVTLPNIIQGLCKCVVCGVWYVACSVWCVVCGVYCVCVLCVACCVLCVVCGVWCVVCGVCGVW